MEAENVGAKYIFYGHKTEFKAYDQFYKMMYRVNWEKRERIRKGYLGECKVNSYISIRFLYLDEGLSRKDSKRGETIER